MLGKILVYALLTSRVFKNNSDLERKLRGNWLKGKPETWVRTKKTVVPDNFLKKLADSGADSGYFKGVPLCDLDWIRHLFDVILKEMCKNIWLFQ